VFTVADELQWHDRERAFVSQQEQSGLAQYGRGTPGERFCRQARMLDIRAVVIAPRSPWQNPYAERVIGSIRRECLDHVVVMGERHLLGGLHREYLRRAA
jgi:transposase InsO family protein